MDLSLRYVRLETHPTARSRARATCDIPAGRCVLAVEPLTTSLIPEEKGRRCDACHVIGSKFKQLLKCSRCASFWYCSPQCQERQWKEHHRKLCRSYNRFISHSNFQALAAAQRVDAILLAQVIPLVFPDDNFTWPPADPSPSVGTFIDLIAKDTGLPIDMLPPLNFGKKNVPRDIVSSLFSRFGNNNFLLHSHLTSYAHGVYPLSSRLFNHSCWPNCATRYIIKSGAPVMMEIVALRDITEGEEITIPYADPALPYDIRQTALQMNYGFTCTCALCTLQRDIGQFPPPPVNQEERSRLEYEICTFALPSTRPAGVPAASTPELLTKLPRTLYPLLNSTYLPDISEQFSKASHEGQYSTALSVGRTLLALYTVLYPPNFPQIGMHALELAKTAWNSVVTQDEGSSSPVDQPGTKKDARLYLIIARGILENFGPEGDEGGPLEEIRVLQELLDEAERT